MEQEFTYQEKVHIVKLDADNEESLKADSFKVSIEDKQFKFNVSKISDNCFSIILDGKSRIVYAAESENNVFVHLDGRVIKLAKADNDQKKFAGDGLAFGVKDEISTPMPGKVVKILVAEGEKVEVGQSLVIVESMKMENDIKSPANGSVKSIHFKAGELVEPGQPIIKLEPDD